jgi:hypothetical protein
MNNYTMNITVIVLGIILLILVYVLYTYFATSTTTLASYADLKNVGVLQSKPMPNTPNPTSTRFALCVWVYVNSYSTGGGQNVIYSVNGSDGTYMKLYLDQTSPILKCDVLMPGNVTGANSETPNTSSIIISNYFPVQKWSYIVISVDNQYVDCYLDGKLVKSAKVLDDLGNTPKAPSDSSTITLGSKKQFDAFISKLERVTNPIDPQTVWTKYLAGNGAGSMTSGYGLNISVLKDNALQNVYKVI